MSRYKVLLDFNYDGGFSHAQSDITDRVTRMEWQLGMDDPEVLVAGPMSLSLEIDDPEFQFSRDAGIPPFNGGRITSYDLAYRQIGTSTWTEITGLKRPPREVTGLTNNQDYEFRIRTHSDAGTSGWSVVSKASPRAGLVYGQTPPDGGAIGQADWDITTDIESRSNSKAKSSFSGYLQVPINGTWALFYKENSESTWTRILQNEYGEEKATRESFGVDLDYGESYTFQSGNYGGTAPLSTRPSLAVTAKTYRPRAPVHTTAAKPNGIDVTITDSSNTGGVAVTKREVQYRVGLNGTWVSSTNTLTGTIHFIGNLTNDQGYTTRVRAFNGVTTTDSGGTGGDGWSSWSVGQYTTPSATSTTPATVATPTATAGNAQVSLSWTAPNTGGSAITHYDVRYKKTSGNTWTSIDTITTTSRTVTSLDNAAAYEFQVRAANANGDGNWSPSVTATPVAPTKAAPDAPGTPTVSARNTALYVTWTAPDANNDPITGYKVRHRQTSPAGNWSESASTTNTYYTITSLTNSTQYDVQVNATNATGTSGWSTTQTGTPAAQKPSTPLKPTVTKRYQSLGLSWSAPSSNGSNITHYNYRYRTSAIASPQTPAGSWTTSSNITSGTTATISTLTNDKSYDVQIRATNSVGDSAWSPTSKKSTGNTVPDPPTGLTLTAGDTEVAVSWTAPTYVGSSSGLTSTPYDLQYRTGGSTPGSWNDSANITTTSKTIDGLTNNQAYDFRVRATNDVGDSSWTTHKSATPSVTITVPAAPSAPSLTAGDAQVVVSWSAPNNGGATISHYDVRYKKKSANTWTTIDTITTTSRTVTSLDNGATYQFAVRAANSQGDGNWSDNSETTPGTVPNWSTDTGTAQDWNRYQEAVSLTVPAATGNPSPTYTASGLPTGVCFDATSRIIQGTPTATGSGTITVTATNSRGTDTWTVAYTVHNAEWSFATGGTAQSTTATTQNLANLKTPGTYGLYSASTTGKPSTSCCDGAWGVFNRCTSSGEETWQIVAYGDQTTYWNTRKLGTDGNWPTWVTGSASRPTWAKITAPSGFNIPGEMRVITGANADVTDPSIGGNFNRSHLLVVFNSTDDELHLLQGAWGNRRFEKAATFKTRPGKMANPTLTAGDTQITVQWTAPSSTGNSPILRYDIRYKKSSANTWTAAANKTGTSFIITGLDNNAQYDVQISAENAIGNSDYTATVTATPQLTVSAPDAPGAPTLTAGHEKLDVSWTAPANNNSVITHYNVRHRTSAVGSTPAGTWSTSSNITTTNTSLTSLTNGTQYDVQVRATNGASPGDSPWSATTKGRPNGTVPQWIDRTPPPIEIDEWATTTINIPAASASPAATYAASGLPSNMYWNATNRRVEGYTDSTRAGEIDVTATNSNGSTTYIQPYHIREAEWEYGAWGSVSTQTASTLDLDDYTTPGNMGFYNASSSNRPTGWQHDGCFAVFDHIDSTDGHVIYMVSTHGSTGVAVRKLGSDGATYGAWTTTLPSWLTITDPTDFAYPGDARVCTGANSGITLSSPPSNWNGSYGILMMNADQDDLNWFQQYFGGRLFARSAALRKVPIPPRGLYTDANNGGFRVGWTRVTGAADTGGKSITSYQVRYRQIASPTRSGSSPLINTVTVTGEYNSLDASWRMTSTDELQYFIIKWQQVGAASSKTARLPLTARSYTIDGLTSGQRYDVTLTAYDTDNVAYAKPAVRKLVRTSDKPDQPEPILCVPGNESVDLSWQAPSNNNSSIINYDLEYRAGGATPGPWTDISNIGDASYTVSSLTNGQAYDFRFVATNGVGDSDWSSDVTCSPIATDAVPAAPAVTITAQVGQIELDWSWPDNKGEKITSYTIQRGQGSPPTFSDLATISVSDFDHRIHYDDDTVSGSAAFSYRVRATNSVGNGAWSTVVSATPLTDTWTTITGIAATASHRDVSSLTPNRSYEVQVRAVNSVGNSPWSASGYGEPTGAKPATPSAPTLTSGNSKLDVSWTAPNDNGYSLTGYTLRYKKTAAATWTEVTGIAASATSYTISSLDNGSAYNVQLKATNSQGDSEYSISSTETPNPGVPSKMSKPSLTAGDAQIAVSWTAPANNGATITSYDIEYRQGRDGSWTEITTGNANTSYTITQLTNSQLYEVRVRATNSAGDGPWSSESDATPVRTLTAPAKMDIPSVTGGDQSAIIYWNAPDNGGSTITAYRIEYRQSGQNTWPNSASPAVNLTNTTITSLENQKHYQFRIRATNVIGNGEWSDIATALVKAAPKRPQAPAPGAREGNTQVVVSWDKPNDGGVTIDHYDLRWRDSAVQGDDGAVGQGDRGDMYFTRHTTEGNRQKWDIRAEGRNGKTTELQVSNSRNGTYTRLVRDRNNTSFYARNQLITWGNSKWYRTTRSDSSTVLSGPTKITSTYLKPWKPTITLTAGSSKLDVTITDSSDTGGRSVTKREVQYREGNSGSWTSSSATITGSTHTISNLTNSTAYQVQARVYNSVGWSDFSTAVSGTPTGTNNTKPSAPAAPTITRGDTQLGVSWTAPNNGGATISSYDVRYKETALSTWTTVDDITTTSTTITSLTNGTQYDVQVRATNSVGDSSWSTTATGTPSASASNVPDAPSEPTVTAGNASIAVSWTAPSNNGATISHYNVRHKKSSAATWTTSSNVTSTSTTLSSLDNGSKYDVQVRATNSVGDSKWSKTAQATPQSGNTVPARPSAPTLTRGESQLGVTWSAPNNGGATITGYTLRYKKPTDNVWKTTASISGLSATLTNLDNGYTYQVQVRATNSVGSSQWSVSAEGAPRAPITDWQYESEIKSRTFVIRELDNDITIEIQVRASNSVGDSAWSASITATPRSSIPKAKLPLPPIVQAGDTKVRVRWDEDIPGLVGMMVRVVWRKTASTDVILAQGWIDDVIPPDRKNALPLTILRARDKMDELSHFEYSPKLEKEVLVSDEINNVFRNHPVQYPYTRSFWVLGKSALGSTTKLFSQDAATIEASEQFIEWTGDVNDHRDSQGVSALGYIQDVLYVESGGRFFVDRLGKFHFHNRYRDNRQSSVATFTDAEMDDFRFGYSDVANRVTITYFPREYGEPGTEIYREGNVPIRLDHGRDVRIRCPYKVEYATEARVAGVDVQEVLKPYENFVVSKTNDPIGPSAPISLEKLRKLMRETKSFEKFQELVRDAHPPETAEEVLEILADQRPHDLTAQVEVIITPFANHADVIFRYAPQITREADGRRRPAWLHKLTIKGTPLVNYDAVQHTEQDPDSVWQYGAKERSPVSLRLVSEEETATSYAKSLLYRTGIQFNRYEHVNFQIGGLDATQDALRAKVLDREIGDVVTLNNETSGHNEDYVIVGESHTIIGAGTHITNWTVRRKNTRPVWILGESKLGHSTVLGI